MGFIQWLFSGNGFMPHGCCYLWNPALIVLHVISDGLIALAYYSIPLTLVYFVTRRKDLAFDWIFLCFAVFIVACGTTHVMEIINIWHPTYWLSGFIKALTAFVSVVTAILLIRLVPKALALPSPDQLRIANESLKSEVRERTNAMNRVESLNLQLSSQTAELEKANQELESFGYSISHDLRGPLRHIEGYVDLLREEIPDLDSTGQQYLDAVSKSARQMTLLIDSLLAFSRLGKADLQTEWVDMEAMIRKVQEGLSFEIKDRNIHWNIDALPKVCVDKALFKQVWINLLSNAVKYTAHCERAEIIIACRKNTADFEFSVRDNGAGFDMQYAEKLFGLFQRLHRSTEFEGTGIGLANVRRIISRHGGRTWAEGQAGIGAVFYFTLPKNPGTTPRSPVADGPAA